MGTSLLVPLVAVLQLVGQVAGAYEFQGFNMLLRSAVSPFAQRGQRCSRGDAIHPALIGVERVTARALGILAVQRLNARALTPGLVPIRAELFSHLVERQSVLALRDEV